MDAVPRLVSPKSQHQPRIRYRAPVLLLLTALACADAPPPGRIGGEPILETPVVLGGIDADTVAAALAGRSSQIVACWQVEQAKDASLSGKVLVRFTIGKDGTVSGPRIQSTSLRNDAAESCIKDQIAQVRFPALQVGDKALVSYPFAFPPS